LSRYRSVLVEDLPKIKDRRNSTIKIKNRTFAIDAAPAAIPPNPNTAAIIATTRNITVQRNITINLIFTIGFRSILLIEKSMPYQKMQSNVVHKYNVVGKRFHIYFKSGIILANQYKRH